MKGSLPIHKYIHDVYKYLSHNTQYTHNTQSICVWYRRKKAPPNFFGGAFAFVDDIGIINVILFVLYVLSWHAIREATEDFVRNSRGKSRDFKSGDAFVSLRT